jgi:hypothetical protein
MNAATPGSHSAAITLGSNDGDESPFEFAVSGTVLATKIIDDRHPLHAPTGYVDSAGSNWGTLSGVGREQDLRYTRKLDGSEVATWTFDVTPGQYRVSATWPFGSTGYDEASPFTVFDGPAVAGGNVRGGRNLNQQVDPNDRFAFGSWWEDVGVVNISDNTLTVQLRPDDPLLFVLADSVLIERLGDAASFTVPAGFTLVTPPSGGLIAPGGSTTFVLRLTAAYEGFKGGAVAFSTNDPDEPVVSFNVAAEVLAYRTMDDEGPGYTQSGFLSTDHPLAYQGDTDYFHSGDSAGTATWTFTAVTPGWYAVALTWLDTTAAGPNTFYSSSIPVTGAKRGNVLRQPTRWA